MARFTRTEMIALGGSAWTPSRGGAERIYLNEWARFIGLEVERYKSGNIGRATLRGQEISNSKARKILGGASVYWCEGEIYVQGGAADMIEEIVDGIAAELAAIEEVAAAEDAERTESASEPAEAVEVDVPALIAALRAAGMTVRAIAAAVGVATSTVYRWARGAFRPRADRAAALAALSA